MAQGGGSGGRGAGTGLLQGFVQQRVRSELGSGHGGDERMQGKKWAANHLGRRMVGTWGPPANWVVLINGLGHLAGGALTLFVGQCRALGWLGCVGAQEEGVVAPC